MTRPDLSRFDRVFCNSLVALRRARADGLASDAKIATTAPAVALKAVPEHKLTPSPETIARRTAFAESLLALSAAIHTELCRQKHLAPYAITLARQSVQLQRLISRGIELTDDDFTDPRLLLCVDTGREEANRLLAAPYWDLLKAGDNIMTAMYPIEISDTVDSSRPPLLDWLRTVNWYEIHYRLVRRWWRNRRPKNDRYRAIIVKPNELIVETACALNSLGYAILIQPPPKLADTPTATDEGIADDCLITLEPVLSDYLKRWLPESGVSVGINLFAKLTRDAVAQQDTAKIAWAECLDDKIADGRTAVFANYPGSPSMIALSTYCQDRGVPFMGFQHGVTREISATHTQFAANFENSITDVFFTFNDEARDVSNESPFARAQSVSVGISAHYRVLDRVRRQSPQPVLFVSTCLYAGNVNLNTGSQDDIDRCRREIDLIENFLTRLPHRVLYKTYPSRLRYADEDPVRKHLEAASNIDVFDQPINLKNIVGKHGLVISARATSTVSVCLLSGRPTAFIDMPDHSPLRSEVREAFAASLFLFDYGDPDVLEKLTVFASQPMQTIEAAWREKAPVRRNLIERYFAGQGVGAGKRAANFIHSYLAEQKEMRA